MVMVKLEIINHHYNNYAFWSIDILGKNSYLYPTVTDNADAIAKGAYHTYTIIQMQLVILVHKQLTLMVTGKMKLLVHNTEIHIILQ